MEIQIQSIRKKYGRQQVLQDVTFSAQSGSCIGLLGCNGCGKSTLLQILAGVLKPDAGSFTADRKDLWKTPGLVGYIPQGTPLLQELSAWDNLRLWYSREELERELSSGVLKMLGINEFLKKPVHAMSGGMKKRLSIGCSVAQRPPILLLDEPTAALDLPCKEQIRQYLETYKRSGGILLLTTHDLSEISLCDRLFILREGRLVPYTYDGDPGKLVENL